MRRFILSFVAILCLAGMSGCGNLSPRLDPKLDQQLNNQNGKIDEIKNNQNGVMAEIGTLKQQAEIQNSKLDKVQQGLANLQINNSNENSGLQILSGSGGLMVGVIGVVGLCIVVMYYRSLAKMHEKTANILAERVFNMNDPALEEAVFQAAMHTDVEENVLKLFKKNKGLKA